MDLTSTYLGFNLKNPIVPSASPLSKDVGKIKEMEDAGASAVVLHSLFEEQITHDSLELFYHTVPHEESFAEATTYFPNSQNYTIGPDDYLEHIRKAKESVQIPVFASLNGVTPGGWTEYAKKMEDAGADALELNVYMVAADLNKSSEDVENNYAEILKLVKSSVKIPVVMKLSPYFSSFAGFAKKLDSAGANGLLLFNRFYQPDIDLETLEVIPNVLFSNPQSMRLPLRWIAILYGRIKADLAATSGIHTAEDIIKMVMVGAKITQVYAALHQYGIGHIRKLLRDIKTWMIDHEYESLDQMRGSMSHRAVANPAAFERANYMRALSSIK
jgi:dihydroorotate dehydrogenase (fumarate)